MLAIKRRQNIVIVIENKDDLSYKNVSFIFRYSSYFINQKIDQDSNHELINH